MSEGYEQRTAGSHPSPPPEYLERGKIEARRGLLTKLAAICFGAVAILIPAGAGLAVLFDPLRRKSAKATFLKVTTLDALPADGSPRKFPVVSDRTDAWSKFPNTPIGAVYLQRKGDRVTAFNVRCPHAGCFVDAVPGGQGFHCPCHNSRFNPDGSLVAGSVSPRGLDQLEVDPKSLKQGIIQVRFENFAAGTAERIPRT